MKSSLRGFFRDGFRFLMLELVLPFFSPDMVLYKLFSCSPNIPSGFITQRKCDILLIKIRERNASPGDSYLSKFSAQEFSRNYVVFYVRNI